MGQHSEQVREPTYVVHGVSTRMGASLTFFQETESGDVGICSVLAPRRNGPPFPVYGAWRQTCQDRLHRTTIPTLNWARECSQVILLTSLAWVKVLYSNGRSVGS